MFGIIDSVLSMKLDVYKQVDSQDEETGAIRKYWQYYKTLDCHAKGVVSNSATTRTSDKQVISNKYTMDQIVQVRTEFKLSLREKISNIRNSDGEYIWQELDYPNETPTVFEVIGTTPLTDPFGVVIGYNSSLKRSEVQRLEL
jgi:hypothetical protein